MVQAQQQQESEMRRGSVASRLSQMSQLSRREKVEEFQRRRSTSIYSDTERAPPGNESPVYSYEDHTPVNELNLSVDMNDLTPVATQVIEFELDNRIFLRSLYVTLTLFWYLRVLKHSVRAFIPIYGVIYDQNVDLDTNNPKTEPCKGTSEDVYVVKELQKSQSQMQKKNIINSFRTKRMLN